MDAVKLFTCLENSDPQGIRSGSVALAWVFCSNPPEIDVNGWFEALDRSKSLQARRTRATARAGTRGVRMSYLLHVNACIAIINDRPQPVRERFAGCVASGPPDLRIIDCLVRTLVRRGQELANFAEFGRVAGLRWENWAAG
jgi:hypothetical protein